MGISSWRGLREAAEAAEAEFCLSGLAQRLALWRMLAMCAPPASAWETSAEAMRPKKDSSLQGVQHPVRARHVPLFSFLSAVGRYRVDSLNSVTQDIPGLSCKRASCTLGLWLWPRSSSLAHSRSPSLTLAHPRSLAQWLQGSPGRACRTLGPTLGILAHSTSSESGRTS